MEGQTSCKHISEQTQPFTSLYHLDNLGKSLILFKV